MRIFERGKRKENSPYQLAGINPGCDDWLERTCLAFKV
jgi:hypothetical protein